MSSEFGDRVRKSLDALGKTQADVARDIDIEHDQVNYLIRAAKKINKPFAYALAHIYGVNPDYLLHGNEPMFLPETPVLINLSTPSDKKDIADLQAILRNDHKDLSEDLADISRKLDVLIKSPERGAVETKKESEKKSNVIKFPPYYRKKEHKFLPPIDYEHEDWQKAAGAGFTIPEDLRPHEWYSFITRKVSKVPVPVEFSLPIEGNSMEPTITNGAIVYCNTVALDKIQHNDLLVFVDDINEKFKLRRVKCAEKDGEIICFLVADNPKYGDCILLDENIRIAGVVVYCSNEV